MLHVYLSKYWFKRGILHFKNKGFISLIKHLMLSIIKILDIRHSDELPYAYLFKKKRILNKNFIKKNLLKFDDINIERYFNYFLNTSKIKPKPIIYAFGVGSQIKFEEALVRKFDIEVFCYDPTSHKFFENFIGSKKIKFYPFGIWVKDEKVKLFHDGGGDVIGGSISNLFQTDINNFEEVQCYTLQTLMNKNNHKHIDILKMDIEGIAIEVIENIIENNIYPEQVVTEFEFLEKDDLNKDDLVKYNEYSLQLESLINKMKSLDYKCYEMPRFTNGPYSTIEVLFVRN